MPSRLPSGAVTFLFSDIEGSTQLLQRLGARYAEALAVHQELLRSAFAAHGGQEVDTQGDSFFIAFSTAGEALAAAADAQHALARHLWPDDAAVRVRMGVHTGAPVQASGRYVGLDVHRAARIAAAGHGGQVLLSQATRDLAESDLPAGAYLQDLGEHRLKDLQRPEHLYQLVLPDLPTSFPPLKSLDRARHNLPVQLTPLVGREEAVQQVVDLVQRQGRRLVTLTGPGGIGKTRLALQVAAELVDAFADGVYLIPLGLTADANLVVAAIARTLGVRQLGDPTRLEGPLNDLGEAAYIRGDLEQAATFYEEALACTCQAGDVSGLHVMLGNLGNVARRQGNLARAKQLYHEALQSTQELGDPRSIAESLEGVGSLMEAAGKEEIAVRLLGAAAAVRDAIGTPALPRERTAIEEALHYAWTALGEAAWMATFEAGRALSLDDADLHPGKMPS
jgi:class 3 adenylate cyclase